MAKQQTTGGRLRNLREINQYSLRYVAGECGVSANTVLRWEEGTSSPKKQHIIALAELYNREPSWIQWGAQVKREAKDTADIVSALPLLSKDQLEVIRLVIKSWTEKEVKNGNSV